MHYEKFIKLITSSSEDYWVYDSDLDLYVYRPNVSISIQKDEDYLKDDDEYTANWMNNYPDQRGFRRRFYLKYNGGIVEAFHATLVDGARMYIPTPQPPEFNTISQKQYDIGRIINYKIGESFDDYLRLADIKVI